MHKVFNKRKNLIWVFAVLFLAGISALAIFLFEKRKESIPKVSVIIPVYNAEPYLRECLDSVVKQTYKNIEIVCVNDGSKDNSISILNEYKEKDKRIIVIDKPNGGVSSARNEGLKIATGDYIAFLDSDDWISLDTYKLCIERMQKNKSDIMAFGIIGSNVGEKEDYIYENEPFKAFDEIISSGVATKIFKSDIIYKDSLLFKEDVRYGEDALFTLMSFTRAKNIEVTSQKFYNYRQVETSAEHTLNISVRTASAINRIRHIFNDYGIINYPNSNKWVLNYTLGLASYIYGLENEQEKSKCAKEFLGILENDFLNKVDFDEIDENQKNSIDKFKDLIK